MAGEEDKASVPGSRGFVKETFWYAWGALIALLVAAGATAAYLAVFSDDSITEELSKIQRDAAEQSARPIVNRVVDLRGSGGSSHVLVFRDDRFLGNRPVATFPSDEVRIYEEQGDDLELRLSFQPERRRAEGPGPPQPHLFKLASTADLDNNGRAELVGAYGRRAMGMLWPVPVAIAWDDARSRYVVRPLLQEAPRLAAAHNPGVFGRHAHRAYARPVQVRDDESGITVNGYPVEGFVVVPSDAGPRLVGSFVHRAATHAEVTAYEIVVWNLDMQSPYPSVFQCSRFRGPPALIVEGRQPSVTELRRLWQSHSEEFAGC